MASDLFTWNDILQAHLSPSVSTQVNILDETWSEILHSIMDMIRSDDQIIESDFRTWNSSNDTIFACQSFPSMSSYMSPKAMTNDVYWLGI